MIFPLCLSYIITTSTRHWTLYPLKSNFTTKEFDYRKPLTKENAEQVLNLIRPSLQSDGGDCKLISVENSTITIQLMGNCANCPMKNETVKYSIQAGLEKYLSTVDPIEVIIQSDN